MRNNKYTRIWKVFGEEDCMLILQVKKKRSHTHRHVYVCLYLKKEKQMNKNFCVNFANLIKCGLGIIRKNLFKFSYELILYQGLIYIYI